MIAAIIVSAGRGKRMESKEKKQFMEYVADHGTYADIPVQTIVAGWKEAYGENRVTHWITQFEKLGGKSSRDFDKEEILK